MSDLAEIFRLRTIVDARKQRRWKPVLDALCVALRDEVKRPHPYDLSPAQKKYLRTVHEYREGARGADAHLDDEITLYRLMPIALLRDYVTNWIGPQLSDGPLLEYLLDRSGGHWLGLGELAEEEFCNSRRFSWWTTFDGLLQQPFTGGRRMGLVDDWIASDSVLLRLGMLPSTLVRVCVPSIIDGFDGAIFDAVDFDGDPSTGMTIDLNPPGPVRSGVTELAISPIPVDAIWLLPMKIDGDLRSGTPVPQTAVTWRRLADYYRNI